MSVARRPYGGVSAEDRVAGRRARLLDATLSVIGEHGVAAVTVDLICSEAQLGKRYFYESFADRDALLVALADDLYSDLRTSMEEALPETDQRRPRAESVVRTLLEVLEKDARRARLYAESAGHPALGPRRTQAIGEFTGFVCSTVFPPPLLPGENEVTKYLACRVLISGATELMVAWLSGDITASPEDIVEAIAGTAVPSEG